MRILVVEDDPRIASDLDQALSAAGYAPDLVGDGETAWFKGDTEDYAAVILDLGLPGLDGLTILKRWRENGRVAPVLILTARGNWIDRVDGIDAGADDYLPKPFEIEELQARLRAIIRRSGGRASSVYVIGDLTLDARQMKVTLRGAPVALSPLEYRSLAFLALHRGRVVSHGELTEHIRGLEDAQGSNAIEVLIGRLRKKIGQGVIETRRGFGYIIETEAQ